MRAYSLMEKRMHFPNALSNDSLEDYKFPMVMLCVAFKRERIAASR